jgi:Fe2+ transport system protein B
MGCRRTEWHIVFIPQIMILLTITVLRNRMAMHSFLTDKLMRVGLNGKSVMPMISGFARARPAIMSSRILRIKKKGCDDLDNTLMSCSARLPVYTMLIAPVFPITKYGGFSTARNGDDGFVSDGVVGPDCIICCQKFIHSTESYFILELPTYRATLEKWPSQWSAKQKYLSGMRQGDHAQYSLALSTWSFRPGCMLSRNKNAPPSEMKAKNGAA